MGSGDGVLLGAALISSMGMMNMAEIARQSSQRRVVDDGPSQEDLLAKEAAAVAEAQQEDEERFERAMRELSALEARGEAAEKYLGPWISNGDDDWDDYEEDVTYCF